MTQTNKLFRAWDEDRKRMYYPDTTDHPYTHLITGTPYPKLMYLPMSWLLGDSNDLVWMQDTGFEDKNGQKIYQGDIIESDGEQIIIKNPQWFQCDDFSVYGYHNLYSFSDDYFNEQEPSRIIRECVVIGNIYENSNLINI